MFKKLGITTALALVASIGVVQTSAQVASANTAAAKVSTCKVATQYKGNIAQQPWLAESNPGFPKGPNRLKSFGTIKAAMIFVEFTDVKGTDNPVTEAKKFTGFFNDYWTSVTRNKLKFSFQVHPRYIKINKKSSAFGMGTYGAGDPSAYLADAIKAADPLVDFKGVEVVYVIPPSSTRHIVYGPAFPLDSGGNAIKTKEGLIYSAVVGGSDSRNSSERLKGVWLAHETGHLFGLPHPYESKNIAAWDLMHWDSGAPELLGWSRFVNGWVADSEVDCLDFTKGKASNTTHLLEPLSSVATGKKLLVAKVSKHKVLVLENRRATKIDLLTKNEEGVIAYLVDMKKYGDYYINLIGPNTFKNTNRLGSNKPGSSIRLDRNISIKFDASTTKGDTFTITYVK
jgi:M6 family metalloprotease-like protein